MKEWMWYSGWLAVRASERQRENDCQAMDPETLFVLEFSMSPN